MKETQRGCERKPGRGAEQKGVYVFIQDRLKAIKLYIKYNLSIADTIRKLGYPSRNMLRQWYQEYTKIGKLHRLHCKKPQYSMEDKKHAGHLTRLQGCSSCAEAESLKEQIYHLRMERAILEKSAEIIKNPRHQSEKAGKPGKGQAD